MNKKSFVFIIVASLALTGCATSQYQSEPLHSLKVQPKKDQKAIVYYKPLTSKESVLYLGRNWQKKGYLPVQIAIENLSDDTIRFYNRGLSLPALDFETIKQKAHAYTTLKVMSIGAPSVTCLAVGIVGLVLAPATLGATAALIPIGLGGAGLKAASTVVQAKEDLDHDYQKKLLFDRSIPSHAYIEGIILVPKKQFKEHFTVKLFDPKENRVIAVEAVKAPRR